MTLEKSCPLLLLTYPSIDTRRVHWIPQVAPLGSQSPGIDGADIVVDSGLIMVPR